jgi:hypothetical protein
MIQEHTGAQNKNLNDLLRQEITRLVFSQSILTRYGFFVLIFTRDTRHLIGPDSTDSTDSYSICNIVCRCLICSLSLP